MHIFISKRSALVLAVMISSSTALDALSQMSAAPNLPPAAATGVPGGMGAVGALAGDNSELFSGRALIHGKDPFAGAEFEACQQRVRLAAVQEVPTQSSGTAIATRLSAAAMGTIAAGLRNSNAAKSLTTGLDMAGAACGSFIELDKATSCDAYKVGNKFQASEIDKAISELTEAQEVASCSQSAAKRAAQLTDCFSAEFERLRSALRDVKTDFDEQIVKFDAYLVKVDEEVQKEETKIKGLEGKRDSLEKTLGRVEGLIRKFNATANGENNGTVNGLRKRLLAHNALIQKFERRQKREPVMRAVQCLTGGGAAASALSNCKDGSGHLMTPKNCILSRYQDQYGQHLAQSKNVSPGDRNKARGAAVNFEERLSQLLSQMTGPNPMYLSVGAFEKAYSEEFTRQYGAYGQHMLDELRACEIEAKEKIKDDLKNPESSLGQEVLALQQTKETINSELGAALIELDAGFRDGYREIFGEESNNHFSGGFNCANTVTASNSQSSASLGTVSIIPTAGQTQMGCVEYLNASLNAMINGTNPPGETIPLRVPLNVAGVPQDQTTTCQGLRDCHDKATKLQAAAQNRVNDLKGEGTFADTSCPGGKCPGKKRFIREKNTLIQTALQQAAKFLGPRVQGLLGQFSQLRSFVSGADIDIPKAKPDDVDVSSVCASENEKLCKMPANFADILGGMAGLPGLKDEMFADVTKSARTKQSEASKAAKKMSTNIEQLKMAKESCQKDAKEKKLTKSFNKANGDVTALFARCKTQAGITSDKSKLDLLFGSQIENAVKSMSKICDEDNLPDDVEEQCVSIRSKTETEKQECYAIAEATEDKNIERSKTNELLGRSAVSAK